MLYYICIDEFVALVKVNVVYLARQRLGEGSQPPPPVFFGITSEPLELSIRSFHTFAGNNLTSSDAENKEVHYIFEYKQFCDVMSRDIWPQSGRCLRVSRSHTGCPEKNGYYCFRS